MANKIEALEKWAEARGAAGEEGQRAARLARRCVLALCSLASHRMGRSLALMVPDKLRALWRTLADAVGETADAVSEETAEHPSSRFQQALVKLESVHAALHLLPSSLPPTSPFADAGATFARLVAELSRMSAAQRSRLSPPCPVNDFLVWRFMVTPSRLVPLGETPVRGSRFLRAHAPQRHLCIVTFRDEQGQELRDPGLSHSALDVLRAHVTVGGLRYVFVNGR